MTILIDAVSKILGKIIVRAYVATMCSNCVRVAIMKLKFFICHFFYHFQWPKERNILLYLPPLSVPFGVDKLCNGVSEARFEQMTGLGLEYVGLAMFYGSVEPIIAFKDRNLTPV